MQDNFGQGLHHLGNALTTAGRHEEAISVLRQSISLWKGSGLPRYVLCFALAADGRMEEARAILSELLADPEMKAYFIAMAYVAVGDHDNAFRWFEKSVEERNEWLVWFAVEPKLDPIRGDRRYKEILKKLRNPMITRDSGSFERKQETGEREKSIAVLPFKLIGIHESSSQGEEFLSIGLADALTMRLSNIGRFLVRPTSSVLSFNTYAVILIRSQPAAILGSNSCLTATSAISANASASLRSFWILERMGRVGQQVLMKISRMFWPWKTSFPNA